MLNYIIYRTRIFGEHATFQVGFYRLLYKHEENKIIDQAMNQKNITNYVLISILLLIFCAVFFPVWTGLVKFWYTSEEYSHGFLIFPLSMYIIWQKKDAFAQIPVQPSDWGLFIITFSMLVFIIARACEILTLGPICMILIIIGTVIYFYGFLICKELFFPLFFLFFMIPIPSQIYSALTIPLQLFVTKTTVFIVSLMGITIYREGNLIHLSDHTMQVVQACSGLRSMVSLLVFGAIFGYFSLRSNMLRGILFVAGIPISIIVNILRVFLMVIAYHYFRYDFTEDSIHTVFGMIIFIMALIIIAATQRGLSFWDKSAERK